MDGVRDSLVDRAVGRVFRAAARCRGARALHPRGVVLGGRVRLTGTVGRRWGVALLDEPARHAVLARLSSAVGTPEGVPDALGLAVRIVDGAGPGRAVDLLFTTAGDGPVGRRLPLPCGDVLGRTYSGLLPYRAGDRRCLLAAVPFRRRLRVRPEEEAVRRAVAEGPLRFDLVVAGPWEGWRPFGRLSLEGPVGAGAAPEPSFDVHAHAADRLAPAGPVQALRPAAYAGSRAGRGAELR
ncbi:phosphodiesterase [Allostreptomyces psammosilenae]|uniref:Phosphodiesterase n=1 Tax=Allostreptomyces psammosilenae TaxID=1892865 RepID=A0A852ZQN9_9ACTN|nr:phosphodiesterase [Allostreptomyces psammosilenae]NYI03600.1 hypothetical protein [Allostreptomyces psammosilenae]